jgi:hypothetical protein
MKLILSCTVVLAVILTGISARAQVEPLVLYDNFNAASKKLDPEKWFGSESYSAADRGLESVRQIKEEPIYQYMGLNILNRTYGNTDSDSGTSSVYNRVLFRNGGDINSIKATVQVKKVQVTGCTANPNETKALARIGGMFFNIGPRTAGDTTNDVWATIYVSRSSSSTDPANVLEIVGEVRLCNNNGCGVSTIIGAQDLGTVLLNKKVKLRMTWDPQNDRFIFQKGKDTEVYITYNTAVYPESFPPGAGNGGAKRLDVAQVVANCASQPQPMGFMDVFVEDVYVNESAAP